MAKPQISIIGLGLIGTSLGLALQQVKTDFEIVGHDREHQAAKEAAKMGAADHTEWNLIRAIEDADVIFLAIPVMAIQDTLAAIADDLKQGALISDTASTKQQVMEWAEELLPPHVTFVGGDPIVKQAGHGQAAARADLFQGVAYCLIPAINADREAVEVLAQLISSLGAEPYFVDAVEHDGLVAGVSHLPAILSAGLLRSLADSPASRDLQRMAGQEFRSITELPSEDPAIYRDVCLTNAENIVRWIDTFIARLGEVRDIVASEDGEKLDALFTHTMETRLRWIEGRGESELSQALQEAGQGRFRSLLFGSRFG